MGVAIPDSTLATLSRLSPAVGKSIKAVPRRGKYILLELSGGIILVIHLRMTGDLLVASGVDEPSPHTRLTLRLGRGGVLLFTDPRRLGTVHLSRNARFRGIPALRRMGPEPLSDEFTYEAFTGRLAPHRPSGGRQVGYCPVCGCGLDMVRIHWRYSYFCPRCQR